MVLLSKSILQNNTKENAVWTEADLLIFENPGKGEQKKNRPVGKTGPQDLIYYWLD